MNIALGFDSWVSGSPAVIHMYYSSLTLSSISTRYVFLLCIQEKHPQRHDVTKRLSLFFCWFCRETWHKKVFRWSVVPAAFSSLLSPHIFSRLDIYFLKGSQKAWLIFVMALRSYNDNTTLNCYSRMAASTENRLYLTLCSVPKCFALIQNPNAATLSLTGEEALQWERVEQLRLWCKVKLVKLYQYNQILLSAHIREVLPPWVLV